MFDIRWQLPLYALSSQTHGPMNASRCRCSTVVRVSPASCSDRLRRRSVATACRTNAPVPHNSRVRGSDHPGRRRNPRNRYRMEYGEMVSVLPHTPCCEEKSAHFSVADSWRVIGRRIYSTWLRRSPIFCAMAWGKYRASDGRCHRAKTRSIRRAIRLLRSA